MNWDNLDAETRHELSRKVEEREARAELERWKRSCEYAETAEGTDTADNMAYRTAIDENDDVHQIK